MPSIHPLIAAPILALLLNGCLAKAALDTVTAPARVASKAIDLATTSQSEADEKRGRELRKREEQLGKLERQWRKQDERCRDGESEACRERQRLATEIDKVKATLPQSYPE